MTLRHGRGPGLRWIVTDRDGGCSRPPYDELNLADHVGDEPAAVEANRRWLTDQLAMQAGAPVLAPAVITAEHGRRVHVVDAPGPAPAADILVTDRPRLPLLALAADCMPVVLADPAAGVLAVMHSGWRGVAADAAGAAVAGMADLGAIPERIRAHVGPSICAGCFEISVEVRDSVETAAPGSATTTRWGTPAADLPRGLRGQLARAGVMQVSIDPRCTMEDAGLFSYRRDGTTGRHGLMAVMTEVEEQDEPAQ